MAKVSESELLRLRIVEVDGEIQKEWGRIAKVIESNPTKSRQDLLGEFTRIYNLLTRRHMLEVKRTYPSVQVMYQVEFLGVRDADGNWRERPAKKARIADGGIKGDILQCIEVKPTSEIMRAIPKKAQNVFNDFVASSSLGKEIAKEKYLLRWANRRGVTFWFSAQDPITLATFEFEIPVEDIRFSRVQSYMNMGDGIEASRLFKSPPRTPMRAAPNAGGSTSEPSRVSTQEPNKATADPRGISNPATNNRGTETKAEISTFKAPPYRLPNMPARKGKTATYNELLESTNPSEWLEGNKGTQQATEGAAMMIHNAILNSLDARAKAAAVADVQRHSWEIEQRRRNGEYVAVYLTFYGPETPEIDLGVGKYEPGQYLEYPPKGGVDIRHTPKMFPDGTIVSPEEAKAEMDNPSPSVRQAKGDELKVVNPYPGRVRQVYKYAFYLPYPPKRIWHEPYWLRELRRDKPELLVELERRSAPLPVGGYGSPFLFLKAVDKLTEENLKKIDPYSYGIIKPWLEKYGRCTVDKAVEEVYSVKIDQL